MLAVQKFLLTPIFKKNKPNRVVFSELLFLVSTSWLHGPSMRVQERESESDIGSHDILLYVPRPQNTLFCPVYGSSHQL